MWILGLKGLTFMISYGNDKDHAAAQLKTCLVTLAVQSRLVVCKT